MRNIINKPVSTQQLLETAREIYRRGWTTIKLYFMIGHPRETLDDVKAIADLCKAVLQEGNLNRPEETMLEAWLSRGDRRLAEVIYRAWQLGAKFDAWHDHLQFDAWMQAFREVNLSPWFYVYRERMIDEPFPWDHIHIGVTKEYLAHLTYHED